MTNFVFRLYGLSTCPFCQAAFEHLRNTVQSFQYILADGDPIALEGVKAVVGANTFPVLVTNATGELLVVKGYQEKEYARLVQAFAASASAKPAYKVVDAGNAAGAAPAVAQPPQRPNGGAARLPAMSRAVDNAADAPAAGDGGVGSGSV